MCSRILIAVVLALSFPAASSIKVQQQQAANPIRKVVMMLQNMQSKVLAEGKKEADLFAKFMCYCKKGKGDLTESITTAEAKVDATGKAYDAATAKKAQTEQDAEAHKADRAAAKEAMAKATALRKSEAAAYAKESGDLKQNLDALGKAIAAIEKGAAGSFLQTNAANMIKEYAIEKANLPDFTRQELLAFLSGSSTQGYNPASGQITGILKTMQDEMSASLAQATAEEESAIKSYDGLIAAKKKEVTALSAQIEAELGRIGELGVEIATMGNDIASTQEALAADKKFLEQLEKGCKTKAAEWAEIKKTRAEELVALAETIKVLNDDDALELFKKTLPGAGSSFVQIKMNSAATRASALAFIRAAANANGAAHPGLDLIALALNGKSEGFDKVIKMIDEMVVNLKKEQDDDNAKKDFCNKEFDTTDDKKKGLEIAISNSEVAIEDLEGSIANLADEIKALQAGIKALDKDVAEATEQRKADNADYKELMANDAAAKEVLRWAKNRLNKFYNPKMYIAPPKRELSEQDSIVVNMGGSLAPTNPPAGIAGTGIEAFAQAAPAPPPETFDGYHKKSGEGTGVIAMIDLLVKDLDKEMQIAEVNEKDAQKDYEALMAQAASKRSQDSSSSTNKAAAKAEEEEMLGAEKTKKDETTQALMGVLENIKALHGDCDWLLQYYDARKEARAGEIESLGKARAVLSGADFA